MQSHLEHIEWEVLQRPHEIREIESSSDLPEGSQSIEVWRDKSYKLKAKITGISHKDDKYKLSGDGTAGKKISLFQIKGSSLHGLNNYELNYCYIDGIQKRWMQNGQQSFVASLNPSEMRVKISNKSDPAWLTDWYLNGPYETSIFPKTTSRTGTQNFERIRNSIDKTSTKFIEGPSGGFYRDFAFIDTKKVKFILSQVPKGLGPEWSNNIGIEYRVSFEGIPNAELRKAIGEIVSFIVGRQLLFIGYTLFNNEGYPLEQVASSPWGNNVVHVCQKPDCSPNSFTLKEPWKIEKVLTKVVPTYLDLFNELNLKNVLSFYWISRNMPIGTNLPILASGLEILMNAWLTTNNSKTKGVYMPKKEFDKLFEKEFKQISKKLKGIEFGERILRRLSKTYEIGVNERFEFFFDEIGLKVGKVEKKAINARNKMAHGRLGSTDEDLEEMVTMTNAYETLFHRTLLKILGYEGAYIDRSIIGFPQKNIEEPAG